MNNLPHVPGGLISRSFSQWSLNSYAKFTKFQSPKTTWGSAPQSFMSEPSSMVHNPYVASEAQIKGISLYSGVARTTVANVEAPVYLAPGANPYAPGPSTNFGLTTNTKGGDGLSGAVAGRPSYSSPSTGISLAAQVTDSRSTLGSATLSPSDKNQSSAAVTASISAPTISTPILTITNDSEAGPTCIDAPVFPPGTIQCPVGFQVVINGNGDETGCIPTSLWEAQQDYVASNLRPPVRLLANKAEPEDQEWYTTQPPDSLIVETLGVLNLCQGPYLPASPEA